ncbi:hydroxymethylglutaryl-CoA synthase [Streptococcus caprae]|uniref:Hydroxymethylglutaryl-CoA synthase n=1 Tax=Streptococcus caprae TaxID=1640501 RepID=A0ABV8CUK1_9STRE
MTIGIDKIGFATSQYALNMADLAQARGADPAKFNEGLLLDALSITPITEDIITLGASAADSILTEEDCQTIDMVIVATESGVDQSKAAAVTIHHLLNIQPFARAIEMKEACYSATAALDYARLHIEKNPDSRVLVIASDIAKYGIETAGESTQGAGSLALLVSANPRILELDDNRVAQTRDIWDFWRPNYSETPYVNGMYSTKQYLDTLKTTWEEFQRRYQVTLEDFAAFCFHIPFPKLALKGLNKLITKDLNPDHKEKLLAQFDHSIAYSRQIGNIYTGSLYLGLLSLMENSHDLQGGDKIGFFSYGSGAVCEIFQGTLVDGFRDQLQSSRLDQFSQRQALSVAEYEALFYEQAQLDGQGNATFPAFKTGAFALTNINQHQRMYQKVADND